MRERAHAPRDGQERLLARGSTRVWWGVVFVLSSVGGLGFAQGMGSAPSAADFHPIGDYVLDVAGQRVPDAEFYLAEDVPALLVLTSKAPSLVLLFPGESAVKTGPKDQMSRVPDGSLHVVLSSAKAQGRFQILASWLTFSLEDREWTLKPKPWLLGVQDIPSMLEDNPEYVWRSKSYTPDRTVIEHLKTQPWEVNVRVFFGSWCAFCKRHVPFMVKVAEQLQGSSVHIDFYGLPQGWGQHPVAGPLQIRSVPTAVVSIGGKEVGRITGEKWKSPEVAIKELLPKQ